MATRVSDELCMGGSRFRCVDCYSWARWKARDVNRRDRELRCWSLGLQHRFQFSAPNYPDHSSGANWLPGANAVVSRGRV